ncbi:hypothetical protein [Parabacteroides distasonis]|uniref:hypothetical protein n=1 Tax=Parabacteroides distasonis TaxID=823 RepID=UPI0028042781|nr:hypothetical protein [Parabacteroides distasonis]WMI40753.1 hypothetical protein Q8809_12260 [Parabacteroides distasonis]
MTKLSNIPAKETTAKTAKARKAKTEPAKLKWDPTKPMQFTQEEIREHIHEIEKGPFYPIEEVHQRIRSWMDNYQGKK